MHHFEQAWEILWQVGTLIVFASVIARETRDWWQSRGTPKQPPHPWKA